MSGPHALGQTPEPAGDLDFSERIGTLLGAAPKREIEDAAPVSFYYADLAGQLASAGIERPDADRQLTELPAGFAEATMAIPLASRPFVAALDPEWFSTFGFNPLAIGQSLDLFDAPNVVSIFSGGFDPGRVERALEASGYQPVLQESGGSYWTFGDDLALDTPVGRLGAGQMNHAMVSDAFLVFAQREEDVQVVSWAIAGNEPSMLDQEVWAEMVSMFSRDTVGLIPLAPHVLRNMSGAASPVASPVPEGGFGEVTYLAFGVRAGSRSAPLALVGEGTPEPEPASDAAPLVPARIEARIWYGSEETAAREVEAIPVRWAETSSIFTGEPYSDLMKIEDARVSEQNPHVVEVDFVADIPNRWTQLIHSADLTPLVPTPPQG